MSLAEQLGNVGSEIGRASRWQSRNPETARLAFHRALELLDLTLADPRLRASRPAAAGDRPCPRGGGRLLRRKQRLQLHRGLPAEVLRYRTGDRPQASLGPRSVQAAPPDTCALSRLRRCGISSVHDHAILPRPCPGPRRPGPGPRLRPAGHADARHRLADVAAGRPRLGPAAARAGARLQRDPRVAARQHPAGHHAPRGRRHVDRHVLRVRRRPDLHDPRARSRRCRRGGSRS